MKRHLLLIAIALFAGTFSDIRSEHTTHISTFGKLVRNQNTSAADIVAVYKGLSTLDLADANNLLKIFRKTTIQKLEASLQPAAAGRQIAPAPQAPQQDFDWAG